jgi:beta-lactamase superfamily II metal-dependent hydrolase
MSIEQIIKQKHCFAVYPSVILYDYKKGSKSNKKKLAFTKQLLFGDYIKPEIIDNKFVTIKEKGNTYIKARSRNTNGYVLLKDIQAERVLEVNTIDVGQGDGSYIVTPDDKHFLIDAGVSDNMFRFLKWRFNLKNPKNHPPKITAIITHSDKDHYYGFNKIFAENKEIEHPFAFTKIYHNGLVETGGGKLPSLGKLTDNKKYITNLVDTPAQFTKLLKAHPKPATFIKTLSLSSAPKESLRYGCPPIYNKNNIKIEVVGPVAQQINSQAALPVFGGNTGKTKNGHSVILRLCIGKLKILLGGDLNSMAEYYLLNSFSNTDVEKIANQLRNGKITAAQRKSLQNQLSLAIAKSNKYLGADIAKSCHHGSSDFTIEFLKAVDPIVTLISSGDDEPHCHPRPDTLGTIGKNSRGERPLIFSTELARSSKEFIEPKKIIPNKKNRAVTVYGMINVRTDGTNVIIAQKLERKAAKRNWDIHKIEWNEVTSQFEYKQFLEKE